MIVGGGVAAPSIAYHLAELGWRDVVLLDRAELTSGSTFHSAGLVGQLRASVPLTRMMMYSVELYRRLDCGWVECGGHAAGLLARALGGDAPPGRLGADVRAAARADLRRGGAGAFPLMATDGVLGASWLPTDGYLDPSRLTYALVEGARARRLRRSAPTRA